MLVAIGRFVRPTPSKFSMYHFSNTGSLRLAQKILYKIYDCQLNDFDRLVVEKTLTVKLGGKYSQTYPKQPKRK